MSDENNMNPSAENVTEKTEETVQEMAENAHEKTEEAVQETIGNAAEEAEKAVKPVRASRAAMIQAAAAANATQETPVENTGTIEKNETTETTESTGKTGKKRKKPRMWEVTPENDIRYKGILSYRHFRIAGWVCMAMTIANIFLGLGMKINEGVADKYGSLHNVLSFFAGDT